MAEEAEKAGTDPKGAGSAENAKQEPTIAELMGVVNELKKAQSGSDRKVLELSEALTRERAEKEELAKERMSEKERAAFELKKQQDEIATTKAELQRRELALERANIITDMQVPKDLAPFISGKDREDIMSNAKALMTAFSTAVKNEANKQLAGSTPKPVSGDAPQSQGPTDLAGWKKIWAMKAGPEKDAALESAFAGMAGQEIPIMGEG